MPTPKSPIFSAFLVLSLAGCGGGDDADSAAADGGPPNEVEDGGLSEADAAPQVPTKRGWIDVQFKDQWEAGGLDATAIRGQFIAADTAACRDEDHGECHVRVCPNAALEPLAAPGMVRVGPLTYGGNYGWDPGPNALVFSADETNWDPGRTLTVTTEGEDVPAFSPSAPAPSMVNTGVYAPSPAPLDRAQPFEVAWQARSGNVLIRIDQGAEVRPKVRIECSAPGTPGRFTIPAAALADLTPTEGVFSDVVLSRWAVSRATTDAGDYAVTLRILRSASGNDQILRVE